MSEDDTRDRLAAALDKELSAKPDNKLKQAMRAVDAAPAADDGFARTATVWNAWLDVRKSQRAPLDAHDVACMMSMMKLVRTQADSPNWDVSL